MANLPSDPAQEKDALSTAMRAVYTHWGTSRMARAYEELVDAVAHAEEILAALAPSSETEDTAFRVHLLGLECMIQYAHDELERFARFARPLAQDLSACASPTPFGNYPAD